MTPGNGSLGVRVWVAARPETVFGFPTDAASFGEWMDVLGPSGRFARVAGFTDSTT